MWKHSLAWRTSNRPHRRGLNPLIFRGKSGGQFFSSGLIQDWRLFRADRGLLSENSRRLWLSEIRCWKSSPAYVDAAAKFFTDFPAGKLASPSGTLLDFRADRDKSARVLVLLLPGDSRAPNEQREGRMQCLHISS